MSRILIAVAAACLAPAPAFAHIAIAEAEAAPGAYHVASFRVGHGCAGAATTALRVEIPPEVESAKPQPKPGWTVELVRGPDGRVAAATWRGRLPDEQFDAFALMVKLPDRAGPLYFPAVQTCDGAEVRWTDIPAPGAAWGSVAHPAPVATIGAPAGDPAAQHHHH